MATASNFEIEDPPPNLKSAVWQHFGFPVFTNENGERTTDRTKTACKHCKKLITYSNSFASPLTPTSTRAKAITRSIAVYTAKDIRPFSTVENQGFREMLHTLEPKYCIQSRPHFQLDGDARIIQTSKSRCCQGT